MFLPMAFAIRLEDWKVARTFFYYSIFLLIVLSLIAIAVTGYQPRNTARGYLITIFAALIAIPALLALPFDYLVGSVNYFQAYFEMLSCLTTTGATLFDDPASLPAPLHLMRAIVGWLGGFFILVVAMSIFAPLNIGGFEIYAATRGNQNASTQIVRADAARRLRRFSTQIFPAYTLVTAVLT
ncbi:MAG: hypothetical protein GY947_11880, partial [Rhodobacteraceae bacterium]|nr:hypothetical protein [Paracoccaceae bacterium]